MRLLCLPDKRGWGEKKVHSHLSCVERQGSSRISLGLERVPPIPRLRFEACQGRLPHKRKVRRESVLSALGELDEQLVLLVGEDVGKLERLDEVARDVGPGGEEKVMQTEGEFGDEDVADPVELELAALV